MGAKAPGRIRHLITQSDEHHQGLYDSLYIHRSIEHQTPYAYQYRSTTVEPGAASWEYGVRCSAVVKYYSGPSSCVQNISLQRKGGDTLDELYVQWNLESADL